ncbi:MAG: M55 family metallopeptidase [Chloroflexi bacterium]|nr:M55 family metallopeptidase [Chloroflexota bacterium]
MRIYVITDLEGAAMVFTFDQTRGRDLSPEKLEAMRLLTREVNACVDGILDVVPDAEVVVLDGHGSGGISYERFHDRAQLIAGRGHQAPFGIDASFDALFFVGQHAMAGTRDAPLAHTMSSKTIEHYKLNGRPAGEFGLHASLAGTVFGVPTAFLSGDDKAVAEAQAAVPELVGVATKYGLGVELARLLGPGRARELIRAGAAEAVRRIQVGRIAPLHLDPPFTLRDPLPARPGGERRGAAAARLRARRRTHRRAAERRSTLHLAWPAHRQSTARRLEKRDVREPALAATAARRPNGCETTFGLIARPSHVESRSSITGARRTSGAAAPSSTSGGTTMSRLRAPTSTLSMITRSPRCGFQLSASTE